MTQLWHYTEFDEQSYDLDTTYDTNALVGRVKVCGSHIRPACISSKKPWTALPSLILLSCSDIWFLIYLCFFWTRVSVDNNF
jgi:hypothetical protein